MGLAMQGLVDHTISIPMELLMQGPVDHTISGPMGLAMQGPADHLPVYNEQVLGRPRRSPCRWRRPQLAAVSQAVLYSADLCTAVQAAIVCPPLWGGHGICPPHRLALPPPGVDTSSHTGGTTSTLCRTGIQLNYWGGHRVSVYGKMMCNLRGRVPFSVKMMFLKLFLSKTNTICLYEHEYGN